MIQYSIPEMPMYRKYGDGDFPNSRHTMNTTLNLPVHFGLEEIDVKRVVEAMLSTVYGQC